MVQIPRALEQEIDALVTQGVYANPDEAAADLIRIGLESLRSRAPRPPPFRPPPMPPGVGQPPSPGDDAPISVDPKDTRWL